MKSIFQLRSKVPTPKSQEYKHLTKIKWLNIIAMSMILSIFVGSLWFVYTNIYQTIGKVQVMLITNLNLNFEPIDFKLYNDTRALWKLREELPAIPGTVRDPFNEPTLSTSIPTTTREASEQGTVQGQI